MRIRRHAVLAAVGGHGLPGDRPLDVLPAHGEALDTVRRDGPHGAQHLELLLAHGVGVEGHRRLHGDQREQLDEVRLDHVAQGPRLLVVGAAVLHAEGLGGRDLHVVHELAVPHGLEDAVGEAQDQEVLHGLFSQVVVDAVHLPLVEGRVDGAVELLGRGEVAAEGLLDHDARPAGHRRAAGRRLVEGPLARQSRGAELLDDHPELAGRRGQVEHAVAARSGAVQLVEDGAQARVPVGVVELTLDVARGQQDALAERAVDRLGAVVVVDGGLQQRAELVVARAAGVRTRRWWCRRAARRGSRGRRAPA